MWFAFDSMSAGKVYGPVNPVTTSRMPRVVRFVSSGDRSGGNFVRPDTYRSSLTVTARYRSCGAEHIEYARGGSRRPFRSSRNDVKRSSASN